MSPEISICMPVINDRYLRECLESVMMNTYQDFELIINDSSRNPNVADILKLFDVKIIKKETKSFESRYITVKSSQGKKIFLLDQTRLVGKDLFQKIKEIETDMIAIRERDIGNSLVTFFTNLDKEAVPSDPKILDPSRNKSVIPRVYKNNIIMEALERIKNNLPDEILKNVVGLDIELIFLESYKISQDIGFLNNPQILHYGDQSIRDVFKKYYRYGYSQKMLRNTYYRNFSGLSGRNRTTLPFRGIIRSIPIQLLRGIPFIIGYTLG